MEKISQKSGIATLPTVVFIGMMALVVVVSITSTTLNELIISEGSSSSSSALFYAEGGARDALVRIARDMNYVCDDPFPSCYNIDFAANGCDLGIACARVSVTGLGTTASPKIITSKGIMKSSIRTMHINVILDNGTTVEVDKKGEITGAVWSESTD